MFHGHVDLPEGDPDRSICGFEGPTTPYKSTAWFHNLVDEIP